MATREYQTVKFSGVEVEKSSDILTVEEPLQININNSAFTMTMRSPGDDLHLIRGMLHSEDIIRESQFIPEIILQTENKDGVVSKVNVNIPENQLGKGISNSRSLLSVSSCGICGKTEVGDLAFMGKNISSSFRVSVADIEQAFSEMSKRQLAFKKSGGTHAAACFNDQNELISIKEDIGRHNAVDKVIGELIYNNELNNAQIMTVSGRISYEIIIKCFKAGIPILAAVSAPSSLAVDYAKELGITLFGFCRENRVTCYSYPQRVVFKEKSNEKEAG